MTPPLPLLQESAAALKALCSSCGLPKTGTKRLLVHRLRHAAQHFRPVPPSARILSIDLGIKNFAFSLLTPATPPKTTKPSPSTSQVLTSPVHLHAWHRLDLTLPLPSQTNTTKPSKPLPPPPSPPQKEEKTNEEKTDPFSPPTLAALTLTLLHTHLLPLNPTHVLIERQRFRTGGGAAVAEWTLRVNSLEAMLHAALAALNGGRGEAGLDGWDGMVGCVSPRGVAGFLFPCEGAAAADGDGGGGGGGGRGGGAYQVLKREKVGLLGGFLKERSAAALVRPEEGQAEEMVRLFLRGLEARERRGGRRGAGKKGEKEVDEFVTKMDDLSDAVLQGMVWLQWQRNLEGLIRERPELLEEVDE